MSVPSSVIVIVLAFIAACCVVDVHTRRIPNLLSFPVIIAGLLLNTMWLGMLGLINSVLGILLVVAVLIGPFVLGGIGGGDVKMMAAIGALLGPRLALASLGTGMALGGVIMAIHLLRLGRLQEKLGATAGMIRAAVMTQSIAPLRVSGDDASSAIALPYSVPLGLGTVAVLGLALRG
jgi:prepilin peptidase CpaA